MNNQPKSLVEMALLAEKLERRVRDLPISSAADPSKLQRVFDECVAEARAEAVNGRQIRLVAGGVEIPKVTSVSSPAPKAEIVRISAKERARREGLRIRMEKINAERRKAAKLREAKTKVARAKSARKRKAA